MRFLRRTSKPCGRMHKGIKATCFHEYAQRGDPESAFRPGCRPTLNPRRRRVLQVAFFYLGVGLMAAEFQVVCRWLKPSLL